MAEPTLTLKLEDFRNRTSFYLAKGLSYTDLDDNMKSRIDFCIDNALRRFYYPQMDGALYEWTFLHPKAQLSLTDADGDYDLPDNFGGGTNRFTLVGDYKPIQVVVEDAVRAAVSRDATKGTPLYAAIRTKPGTTLTASNRYEAIFYPIPDGSYTAEYTYAVNPDKMTDALPYALGAGQHGHTIMALCLAEAERLENDQQGIHEAEAQILLKSSIDQDKKLRDAQAALPWPVLAAPKTSLGLTYSELQRDVGHMLSIGANPDIWSHDQFERVDAIIQSGYRNFLVPPPVDIARNSHEWSFLRPVTTLATVAEQGDYELPAGFVGVKDYITYPSDTGYGPIQLVGETEIRRFRQRSGGSNTGKPRLAAVRPKSTTHTTEPKWELMLWPIPDAVYTLSYENITGSLRLSDTNQYPLGGDFHAETIRQSVLAMAEREASGGRDHYEYFLERLRASILADRRANAGRLLGIARDTSELEEVDFGRAASIVYAGGAVNLNDRVSALETEQAEIDAFLAESWGGGSGVLQNVGNTFFEVVANSPVNMSAQVSPGLAFVADLGGTVRTVRATAATTLVTFVAPTVNPRIDTVQIDSTGYINVKTGTEAGAPVAPTVDAGTIKLAEIYLRVGMTSIKDADDATNGYITDGRSFV
jgi:hypothetical protein